jgi:hypothetical protein
MRLDKAVLSPPPFAFLYRFPAAAGAPLIALQNDETAALVAAHPDRFAGMAAVPLQRALSAWLPVAVWAALIFTLSSIPDLGTGLGFWDTLLRKAAHVAEYAVLGALLFLCQGFAIAGWARTENQVPAIAQLVTLPQFFFAGVFFGA